MERKSLIRGEQRLLGREVVTYMKDTKSRQFSQFENSLGQSVLVYRIDAPGLSKPQVEEGILVEWPILAAEEPSVLPDPTPDISL